MKRDRVKAPLRKVKSIEEDPYKSWRLELDCGHGTTLTVKRRPVRKTITCPICDWDSMTKFWEKANLDKLLSLQPRSIRLSVGLASSIQE